MDKRTRPIYMLPPRDISDQKIKMTKSKGMKKNFMQMERKNTGVAVLISKKRKTLKPRLL